MLNHIKTTYQSLNEYKTRIDQGLTLLKLTTKRDPQKHSLFELTLLLGTVQSGACGCKVGILEFCTSQLTTDPLIQLCELHWFAHTI